MTPGNGRIETGGETPVPGGAEKAPMVSVVIPLFNKEGQIAATLGSVFDQEFKDVEVIVVNDGSTDGSERAVQPFMDRIRYFKQPNSGPSVARNRGVLAARGKYIAFLDADDLWRPGKLSSQVEFMERNPDIMWSGVNETYEQVGPRGTGMAVPWTSGDPEWVVFSDWFAESVGKTIIGTPGVMLRRQVIQAVGMFDPGIPAGQDMDLWVRIALRYPRYGYCRRPLIHVHNDLPGRISASGRRKYESTLLLVNKWLGLCSCPAATETFRAYVRSQLRILTRTTLGLGMPDIARRALAAIPREWRGSGWWCRRVACWMPGGLMRLLARLRRAVIVLLSAARVRPHRESWARPPP